MTLSQIGLLRLWQLAKHPDTVVSLMRLFIVNISALYFWLRGSKQLWSPNACRYTSLAHCEYNAVDVQNHSFPHDAFGPKPLHIMVDSPKKRRDTPSQKCHVWTRPLEPNSFVPIGHDVFVASPAFCYLQVAEAFPLFDLVELGYELCGGYSRTPGVGEGLIKRHNTLASPAGITKYCDKLRYARGSEKALWAMKYVMPNSESPTETDMAVKLVLPCKHGGYKFPLGEMNAEIDVEPELWGMTARRKLYPDILWRKKGVCLEYDSSLHHEGSKERTRDSVKRSVLGNMGIKTITVTPTQLKDVEKFHGVAAELARYLGIRIRPVSQANLQKRYELNECVKRRIQNDLTPIEWPYI